MTITVFPDAKRYMQAQRISHGRKRNPSFPPKEIDIIVEYYKRNGLLPPSGICHGARTGEEVDSFRQKIGTQDVIGTDILEEVEGKVIRHDFRKWRRDWSNKFTFLYSNSFDHTDNPYDTCRVWMRQVCREGLAFIEWNSFCTRVNRGNCFAASLDEYILLFQQSGGVVIDLLWVGAGMNAAVVVVKR